ncbi:phage scaffolding protein [Clostridium botulinum]|uniref:Scaffolding protein n=1 Tax=Clostridium botulinum TaxID=1491 RepID=A0A9Q1UY08_CLOBO|nr:phage scaffolding protein [Clostridium botulinum]AEB75895.1 scaffold protein [Clostridium botulinum BKT015925]KEH97207.1 scaffolding protein [Clostridium botulinum D str. 16868]KEI04683.1 scaffolding protein [Clostridium botulinum C/D str. Sp77]KLU76766.1 scaffolding protein [Clostridium botulinum V891]KOA75207.1 scaffolding protein [Clostridium botulinum]
MGIKELLKKLGYSDEDITKIENGMKENKIYTTSEENMDIRYSKLKEQKEQLESDLKEANKTLDKVKKDNKDIESLQTEIENYKNKAAESEAARAKEQKEFTIKSKLKDAGCTDLDYMLYKLGDIEKLDIEKELDNKVKELSENNASFFKVENQESNKDNPKIIVNKLPGADNPPQSFTMDQLKNMTAEEINKNWDTIKDLKFDE